MMQTEMHYYSLIIAKGLSRQSNLLSGQDNSDVHCSAGQPSEVVVTEGTTSIPASHVSMHKGIRRPNQSLGSNAKITR